MTTSDKLRFVAHMVATVFLFGAYLGLHAIFDGTSMAAQFAASIDLVLKGLESLF